MATDVVTRSSTSVPWVQQALIFARRTVLVQLNNRRSLAFALSPLYRVLLVGDALVFGVLAMGLLRYSVSFGEVDE